MKLYMCLLQFGGTVLHEASKHCQHELLQHLLKTGIAVDVKDDVSWYMHSYITEMCIKVNKICNLQSNDN